MVSSIGALAALIVAIILILKKISPTYSMMAGAIVGGLIGGVSLVDTVDFMIVGIQDISPAIIRVIAAGILASCLIESNAAITIADFIIDKVGHKHAILAIILATALLCAAGVYGDIAILTVAPIAMSIAAKSGIHKSGLLIAMIGGVKTGTVMSPNPNTMAITDSFNIPLTQLMFAGIYAAIIGIIVTFIFATMLKKKGESFEVNEEHDNVEKPKLLAAISGPVIAAAIMLLRPLFGIDIDPLVALPVGGIAGMIFMKKQKHIVNYLELGLSRMSGVTLLLIGTGTIAGIIKNSELKDTLIDAINMLGIPVLLLGPIACIFMNIATASSTASTTLTSSIFKDEILASQLTSLQAGAMINASSFVFDGLPNGSFFHLSASSVNMSIKERLNILIYEIGIGLSMSITSIIVFGVLQF
ncbi:GntP family permease [Mycoplasma sp. P36-A1]|uniref:GntP family permease n=1 Tax=Mycoplasma sp. P36-A1 TaxID=3252900 RepID=UPI003C3010C5